MAERDKYLKKDSFIFIFVCILVAYLFLADPRVGLALQNFAKAGGLLSIFVAGALYSTAATAPAATLVIFYLGKFFNPLLIAAIGAFGTLCVDYLLFRFTKKKFSYLMTYLAEKFKIKSKTRRGMRVFAIITAGGILASPLPDEIGTAILGAANVKTKWFLIYIYVSKFIGILAISWLGSML